MYIDVLLQAFLAHSKDPMIWVLAICSVLIFIRALAEFIDDARNIKYHKYYYLLFKDVGVMFTYGVIIVIFLTMIELISPSVYLVFIGMSIGFFSYGIFFYMQRSKYLNDEKNKKLVKKSFKKFIICFGLGFYFISLCIFLYWAISYD